MYVTADIHDGCTRLPVRVTPAAGQDFSGGGTR